MVSTEIMLPDGGSSERNALWNAAESAEKRKDARTAREWVVALPAELDADERAELARSFASELASRYGVAVDVAIHQPDREGDNRNHHAHILTTTRQVTRDDEGRLVLGEKATIELSDRKRREMGLGKAADEVKAVRELWEQTTNAALERAGRSERIDARSLKAQGIDREATTHLGPVASEMERRGVTSDRGDGNRQVLANNKQRAALSAEIIDLRAERERREQAAREAAAKAERERLARMSSRELRAEAERLRPPPVRDLVNADPEVKRIRAELASVHEVTEQARRGENQARRELDSWRQAHPWRAKLHDTGMLKAKAITDREKQAAEHRATWQTLAPKAQQLHQEGKHLEAQTIERIRGEQAPAWERFQAMGKLAEQRSREERSRAAAATFAKRDTEGLRTMVKARDSGARGWEDGGRQWEKLPKDTRQKIEKLRKQPPTLRDVSLADVERQLRERYERDPAALRQRVGQQRSRGRDRGGMER